MNPLSYGPTEPHLWLVGKIPTRPWENCRETSERKFWTYFYDDLVDLLMELATERENDSRGDKYLRKHLPRETPAENARRGRSPQPQSNPGKGRGGHLKHMTVTPLPKGKGTPNLFYCRPTDDKGGPCHAPGCDRAKCKHASTEAHTEKQRWSGGEAPRPFPLHDKVRILWQKGAL